jgi:hypothetical protein
MKLIVCMCVQTLTFYCSPDYEYFMATVQSLISDVRLFLDSVTVYVLDYTHIFMCIYHYV